MTLDQAHNIVEIATDAFASKPRNNFCARSKLHGHSFVEIAKAFSLVIAGRRQIAGEDNEMKAACEKFADLAGELIASLEMMVIADEEFTRLANFPDSSPERQRTLLEIVHSRNDSANEEQELRKEETSTSFNLFCWALDYQDHLYWQKVYTRLGLSYDEGSPVGLPKEERSDGKKSFFFQNMFSKYSFDTPRKRREQRRSIVISLLVTLVLIGGFVWWLFS